jgi:type I restriction enzyme S subunit
MKYATINYNEINSSLRFDGSYHLSEGVLFSSKIQKMKFDFLGNLASEIFTAGRTKRIYTSKEKGYPYLSNTDVSKNNPFENCNFNSKKHGFDEKSVLKEGMIVTGRVGAIGQTSYISSEFENLKAMGSDNIIRIVSKDKEKSGYLYSFLASKYGNTFFNKLASGGVQPYISEDMVKEIPIPLLSEVKQKEIHQLIVDASNHRVEANIMLKDINDRIKNSLNLKDLINTDFESFGISNNHRKSTTFSRSIKEISLNSINAFNYSKKIEILKKEFSSSNSKILLDCLDEKGLFSTGAFKRLEIDSNKGIKLINQSDIFNSKIIGKKISKKFIGNAKLVDYGEVLIAGVGTLGEGETFCRIIFANETIENQLVSGEFIRMKTNEHMPSGYLFALLSSDYGFRIIRSTQSGTKLCRPISRLLEQIPIPILSKEEMDNIDVTVKKAHTNYYLAAIKENQAIDLIEKEIDAWQ